MRKFTIGMICGLLAVVGLGAGETKPNIVLLYIDDWAWNGSPVAMNPGMPNSRMPVLQMPNLEKLAGEGMKFTNAYGSPQCSPGRACVLTGQTSARNGFTVYMNARGQDYYDESKDYQGFKVVPCIANETIDPAVTPGIPKALAPMGYVSAHIGKWHMRGDPGAHGYVLHDGDTDNNPGNTLKANLKEGEEKPRRLPADMTDPKLMFSITEKAIGFMEEQVKEEKPFYLQISHYAMHEGRECLPSTREKYVNDPHVQAYYKLIEKSADEVNIKEDPAIWLGMADDLDGRIGAVLDRIDELGIADDTYVIVVADNGYRHEFLPELTQPLHARKWWVWEGGIRVPMIVKGPGIAAGSTFSGNVVNYDFLPTFVEWAGGEPGKLDDIDGVSLAPYLAGENPDEEFLNRNLYFHYPHYRSSMPHSAVVSGSRKVLHFWGHDDIPMLFDLSGDIGEVKNIAGEDPEAHQELFDEMMGYLKEAGGRIPKANPDYDPEKYRADQDYWYRVNWGPFKGERPLDDDERAPILSLREEGASTDGGKPEIRFANMADGDRFPAGSEMRIEVDVTGSDAVEEVKLYMNGMLLNAQGMTTVPRVWSSSGDYLLRDMVDGRYELEALVRDRSGKTAERKIIVTVGDPPAGQTGSPKDEVYRLILEKGDRLTGGKALKFPRLEVLFKLEEDGKLMLRDEVRGRLFEVKSDGSKGPHYAALENGQLKIFRGKPGKSSKVLWESPNPPSRGPSKLGITASKRLVIFRDADAESMEVIWMSPEKS